LVVSPKDELRGGGGTVGSERGEGTKFSREELVENQRDSAVEEFGG
jgi:hypothetical protein